ncbi:hypothetical protein KIW84_042569 [Lathyrus oleraceus]|uniref:Uncharacterized protein n=1 Tax=Pisum sativum TaxID=3888 RepID=A0A9D5AT81_PEA|nr:hypothetical protein KIW84_042569 [Pisum sativum]
MLMILEAMQMQCYDTMRDLRDKIRVLQYGPSIWAWVEGGPLWEWPQMNRRKVPNGHPSRMADADEGAHVNTFAEATNLNDVDESTHPESIRRTSSVSNGTAAWSACLLNDVLLTLHARFKASPDMVVTFLEIDRTFATKVLGKVDADVL